MKMKYLLSAWVCIAFFAFPHAAWSGGWTMEGYEYTLSSYSDQQESTSGMTTRTVHPLSKKGYSSQSEIIGAGGQSTLSMAYNGYPPYVYKPSRAYARMTVTPVFKWHRNVTILEENEVPDPSDNPPAQLRYWERSTAFASSYHAFPEGLQDLTTPGFQIDEVSNGIKSPLQTTQNDLHYVSKMADGSGVVVLDTSGQDTVRGHSVTLSASVRLDAALRTTTRGEGWQGQVSLGYVAEMLNFVIQGRPKLDHDPTDLVSGLYFNFGAGNVDVSRIAAGGKSTPGHEHQGDVIMEVRRSGGNFGYGTPLEGVKRSLLPRLKIAYKEGVKTHATITNEKTTTDAGGRLLAGVLTSRDLLTSAWTDLMTVHSDSASFPRNVHFEAQWPGAEWKMKSTDEQAEEQMTWNPRAFPGQSQTVICKPRFGPDLPLTKHRMRFYVSRVRVLEADPDTGELVEHLYVCDDLRAEETGNSSVIHTDPKQMEAGLPSGKFASFGGGSNGFDTVEDSGEGTYKSPLKISNSPDWQVESVEVAVEDQGVYEKTN